MPSMSNSVKPKQACLSLCVTFCMKILVSTYLICIFGKADIGRNSRLFQYTENEIYWNTLEHSKAQFIRRAAAVPNQIGRIKFGSSTVAARRMNRA